MKSNLLKRNKQLYHVVLLLLVITATVGVISYNNLFCDGQIIGKWIGLGVSLCATTLFLTTTSTHVEYGLDIIAIPFLIASIIVSIHSLLQITGIIHVNTVNGYRVLAGFDNPAGVAASLTVSLPFTFAFLDKVKDSVIKYVALSGTCGVVLTILAIARSRVGILASGIVLLLYVLHTLENVKTRKIIAFYPYFPDQVEFTDGNGLVLARRKISVVLKGSWVRSYYLENGVPTRYTDQFQYDHANINKTVDNYTFNYNYKTHADVENNCAPYSSHINFRVLIWAGPSTSSYNNMSFSNISSFTSSPSNGNLTYCIYDVHIAITYPISH